MEDNKINVFAMDDGLFPRLAVTQKHLGLVLESAGDGVTEAAPDAVDGFALSQVRAMAMAAVLSWIEDGTFTFLALDEYVMGVADLDGDYELAGDEEDFYNSIWEQVADAMLTIGSSVEDVTALVDGEDDAAGERVGSALATAMEGMEADDSALVSAFSTSGDAVLESATGDMVLEAAFRKVKVVRNGKMEIKRKRISGHVRLSAAQRAGMKKARLKSHTSAARLSRKKSMRIRKSRGL